MISENRFVKGSVKIDRRKFLDYKKAMEKLWNGRYFVETEDEESRLIVQGYVSLKNVGSVEEVIDTYVKDTGDLVEGTLIETDYEVEDMRVLKYVWENGKMKEKNEM